MLVNRRQIEIEWGDCDAAGIVYYPRYFAFMDACTAHLIEAATGLKQIGWTKKYGIVGIPMVDTGAKFMIPAAYGDLLDFETRAVEVRRSSFRVEHRVYNRAGALAIEAYETRVWTGLDPDNPARLKGHAIPKEVVDALNGF